LISYPNFVDLRAQSGSAFSDVFAFAFRIAGLNAAGVTQQFVVGAVSGNYFAGLRVDATYGRVFRPGEGETSGDNALVVVSHGYWKRQLGGDLSVIGRPVAVNGKQATIIGIAPESFQGTLFGFPLDGYVTLNTFASGNNLLDRSSRGLNVLGRRKPGVPLKQAQASIDVIAQRLAREYPDSNEGVGIRVIPESSARPVPLVANFVRVIAGLFLFLPALLLLMACLNVTGIVLARGEVRSREMAIRSSLGGGRGRLIRQLLAETLLLSAFGTLAGIVLGTLCVRVAGNYVQRLFTSASNYSVSMDAGLDGRVFAYALLCAMAATGLTGLWPGLRASRVDLRGLLPGSGAGNPPSGRRMYKALVASYFPAHYSARMNPIDTLRGD
ncbi:MAG: FtsX-like permease family protein, partial [Bryobacteraceae bacterium]